jgi:hypothetical protein
MSEEADYMKWINYGDRHLCSGRHLYAAVSEGDYDIPGIRTGISHDWYVARHGAGERFSSGEIKFRSYADRKSDLALAKRLAKAALKTFDERVEMEEMDNI